MHMYFFIYATIAKPMDFVLFYVCWPTCRVSDMGVMLQSPCVIQMES